MSDRVITWIIIGVAFGFTQLWFAYWVVKLLKERQRVLKARRAAASSPATPPAAPGKPVAGGAAVPADRSAAKPEATA
jgi:hypothetical protein